VKLLNKYRDNIFYIDENVKEKAVKNYLGYKLNWYNFVSIHVYKEKLRIYVRKTKLENDIEKRLFTKVPTSYEWGKTPLWWVDVHDDKDIEYIMKAIKESYENAPDR